MRLLIYRHGTYALSTNNHAPDHGRALALEFERTIDIAEDDYAPFGGSDEQRSRYANAIAKALREQAPALVRGTYTFAPEYPLLDLEVDPNPKITGKVLGGCGLSTGPDGAIVADIPF